MPDELTTRDVFQQVAARLTRVEDDLRQLRSDSSTGFDRADKRFDHTDQRFDRTDQRFDHTDQRFDRTDQRFDRLELRFDQLQWRLVGLFVLTWVTVIGSIWLKP